MDTILVQYGPAHKMTGYILARAGGNQAWYSPNTCPVHLITVALFVQPVPGARVGLGDSQDFPLLSGLPSSPCWSERDAMRLKGSFPPG